MDIVEAINLYQDWGVSFTRAYHNGKEWGPVPDNGTFQSRRPYLSEVSELHKHYSSKQSLSGEGIGIAVGEVSGNLCCLEFLGVAGSQRFETIQEEWQKRRGAPLLEETPVIKTTDSYQALVRTRLLPNSASLEGLKVIPRGSLLAPVSVNPDGSVAREFVNPHITGIAVLKSLADIGIEVENRPAAYRMPQHLQLVPAEDILVMGPDEPARPLWGSFLYPGSIHLLSGEAGVGKTTLLYNLSLSAGRGEPFLGIPFSRKLRTLYLDLETPHLLRKHKVEVIAGTGRPLGLTFMTAVDLGSDMEAITRIVKDDWFDLVIVDTINEAFRTQKEEDNAEANRHMHSNRELIHKTDCAEILVHHIGKKDQRKNVYKARGASARAASADVVINMEDLAGGTVKLEAVKNRWAGQNAKLYMRKVGQDRFELAQEQSVASATKTDSQRLKAQEMILEMVRNGTHQRKDILAHTTKSGIALTTAERALSDLASSSRLEKHGYGNYVIPSPPQGLGGGSEVV